MLVAIENDSSFLPAKQRDEIVKIITSALNSINTKGDEFIVNDRLYFREQRRNKFTPCVVNSATFLSSKFQAYLDSAKYSKGETKIGEQSIDGFLEIPFNGTGYEIKDKNNILKLIHEYIDIENLSPKSVYTLFPKFYGMYVDRNLFDVPELPAHLVKLFNPQRVRDVYKIGVEFETGNIASSFRALNKLFVLFQTGAIDAGVFVTCKDKANASTRIWPQTNRNGSFQELNQRNYLEQVSLPLISISFAPDGFSGTAPFLGKAGNTYHPKDTGAVHSSGHYKILLDENEENILCPI